MVTKRIFLIGAGLGGFAAVALGAAGAHLVPGDAHAAALFDTAARYLLIHSAVLVAVTAHAAQPIRSWLAVSGWFFLVGMTVFGGGLTLLALTGWPAAAAATPIGGTSLLVGWLALAVHGAFGR